MRIAILSDIHGNLPALEACRKDASSQSVDVYVSLGDVIGYNPWPNECMDWVRENCEFTLIGNHECGIQSLIENPVGEYHADSEQYLLGAALDAGRWTAEELSETNKQFLKSLIRDEYYSFTNGKLGISTPSLCFAHATPTHPELMHYVEDMSDANVACLLNADVQTKINFVGHSHQPQVHFLEKGTGVNRVVEKGTYSVNLADAVKALIVVPGLGQPRDGDIRTGYGIFDTQTMVFHNRRLDYTIGATIAKFRDTFAFDQMPLLYQRLLIGR